MYYESCFPFVSFGNSELVEGYYDVQFSIDFCTAQGVESLGIKESG